MQKEHPNEKRAEINVKNSIIVEQFCNDLTMEGEINKLNNEYRSIQFRFSAKVSPKSPGRKQKIERIAGQGRCCL